MVVFAYPERMIRCTRLALSRRDQHLGSWGRLYASPLCTSISGQVILYCRIKPRTLSTYC